MNQVLYDYTRADSSGASCVAHAWAKVPEPLSPARRVAIKAEIANAMKRQGAVLVAHYYVDGDLQDLALETGGCVADSPSTGGCACRGRARSVSSCLWTSPPS
jgi:quinolinate synthase